MVSNSVTLQQDKPRLKLIEAYLAFIFAILYVPFINGAATTPRWCFVSIIFPISLFWFVTFYRTKFTIVQLIGGLFLVQAAVSIAWTYNKQAIYDLVKLLILAQSFVIGSYLISLKDIFKGLGFGIIVSNLLLFWLPGGLFINVNTLAEIAVMVLVGLCVYKLWWHIPFVLPSIFLHFSRGAVLTLGLIFSWWMWSKSKITAICFLGLMIIIAIIFTYFGEHKFDNIYDRWLIWRDIFNNITWLGNGLNSFMLYSIYNINTKPMFAHNDLLQILFELGIVGAILVIGFFTLVMKTSQNERYIVGSFIVISMFDFPLHLPVTACICLLTCGYLTRDRDRLHISLCSS